MKKQKQKRRGYRTLLRFFLPTHLHHFNKFLRTIEGISGVNPLSLYSNEKSK
jgi:hypothetical protein